MDYSGYNYQQQQQQHSYGYDPSQIQIQPYDQSYAYQQYYAYNSQYAYFSNTHQGQFQFQSEPAPLHPPGVNPTVPESAPDHKLTTYQGLLDQQYLEAHRDRHELGQVPGQRTGPSQYRGRGGRGGRPFRGAGRGRGHGRGHGVGGGRHAPSHSSGAAISHVAGAPVAAGTSSAIEPSSSVSVPTQLPKQARVQPPAPRKVCCEICKVECNTPEILEQHKNGKKHQKNMRMHEELQRRNALNGQQNAQIPTSQLNLTDQPKQVQESENNGSPAENMGSRVIVNNHEDETQQQNNVGNISEASEAPEAKNTDSSAARGRGLKRKKKGGGKGGKYMRTNDGLKPVESAQTMSFRCELCDVKCESQIVYQSHMTGKKHLSKLRRAHDPQASSGVGQQQALSGALLGLQALYPPDINALSNAINAQVQQGDNDPQVLLAQLLMTVLSQAQVTAAAQVTGVTAAQMPGPISMAGPSYEPQLLQTQVSEITAHANLDNPSAETKIEVLPDPSLESKAQQGSSVSTQIEGGGSETKPV
ncbi:hypothetical protein LR48_Vigan11g053700 [Vigna angularis]|uniref:U1-type domain-containing protein n=2 Tax=Phaseolus angularis TaxID=3914 RepID=A0A0L9VRZ1_PHAAN|nr:uncharacterized protein LOC108347427 isoform X1 [Vigna angularis]KOM57504.1 hypothetical protein LR48_Vigan11g053700 [Vigna angularis]BAT97626.1 hypothetical protein VIGAN_09113200 [Vigna angularis var. angularis]